ncbi:SPFH domain-containing protein [Microbispora bryophytorum]|uniref:SPFH domain-containing protein n=1 Tax=Microbispora bryophytorum TaxID=1460882 RepID=UPI0034006648
MLRGSGPAKTHAERSISLGARAGRVVLDRYGRLLPLRGPGLVVLVPPADRMVRVDLRTITLTIPPQEAITRDNVPVRVNAVAYFKVVDPVRSVNEVENHAVATSQLAQTSLRSMLGRHDLDALLAERMQNATVTVFVRGTPRLS